jgi:hypothetical protein
MFENLVINNPIRRHLADFYGISDDGIEYDRRWIASIHITFINADERPDRHDLDPA